MTGSGFAVVLLVLVAIGAALLPGRSPLGPCFAAVNEPTPSEAAIDLCREASEAERLSDRDRARAFA